MKFFRSCLAPPVCELCDRLIEDFPGLCPACADNWFELPASACEICAEPFAGQDLSPHCCAACLARRPSFEKAHVAVEFAGSAVGLLHALKFSGRRSALWPLAQKGAAVFRAAVEGFDPDLLLAMPLGWTRRWRRGFNQSYLLLQALKRASGLDLPIWSGVRRRTTSPQARLGREERLKALGKSFRPLPSGSLQGRRLLIVDDVLTTGATAEALSKCLLQAGAPSVQVFAFARVTRRKEAKRP